MATFDENGNYIKTEWKAGDKITAGKLNKIEDSLEAINNNDISRHVEADTRLDALEENMGLANDEVVNKIDNLEADMKAADDALEIEDHRIESEYKAADTALSNKIDSVQAGLETDIDNLNTNLSNRIFAISDDISDFNTTVGNLSTELNDKMEAMVAEVEGELDEINTQLEHINTKYNNLDFVNVKDFGAIGDGVTDDTIAIQNAINTGKNVLIPEGNFLVSGTLTISDHSWKRVIKGVGDEYTPSTTIITNTHPIITCLAGGVTIEKIQFKNEAHILEGEYWFIDAYKTKEDNPDIDLTIRHCNFEGLPYAIRIRGRNIIIEDNLFFAITKAVLKIDFTESIDNPLPDDPYVYNNLQSGMRGYILKNNRCHYLRSYLIENVGFNAENITGVQIVNNFMEGTLFVKGYLKDALITGNNAFQVSSAMPMFDCDLIKNVVINGNILKGEDSFDGLYETSMENVIVSPNVENLIFTNNYISNVRTNVFWFNGTSNRLIFENNIGRRISTISGAYVTFTGTEHDDIKIHDKIDSPNKSTWVAIAKGTSTIVGNYNININITGEYERLHGLDPVQSSETSTSNKMSGYYTGQNSGDKTVVTNYKPSIFKISNDTGECYIFNCKKDNIFVFNGVILPGDKFNVLDKTYYWVAY